MSDAQQPQPTQTPPAAPGSPRKLYLVAVAAAVVAFLFTLSFGYADHSPQPHGVKIAVVAPASSVAKLGAGLDRVEPGGFDLFQVRTTADAIHSVRAQAAAGALALSANGKATIITAAAAGLSQQTAITAALTGATAAMHMTASSLDVAPLPTNDRAGILAFVFQLGLLLPSVIGSIGLFLLGARLRIWWRVSAAVLLAVLVSGAAVLTLDPVFGGLTGAGGALLGVGAFGALSFVLVIAALQATVGFAGTGVAAVLLVLVGNAMSGGTVTIPFLPDGFRQLARWMPNGAIVSAVRDVVYFGGNSLGHPLLVLGLWTAAAVAVLIAVDVLHVLEHRRSPNLPAPLHAKPALAYLRRPL